MTTTTTTTNTTTTTTLFKIPIKVMEDVIIMTSCQERLLIEFSKLGVALPIVIAASSTPTAKPRPICYIILKSK